MDLTSSPTPSSSSIPFPRQPRPRFGPRSRAPRPTALIVSDLDFVPPSLHHRHHTEPTIGIYDGFYANLDFVDAAAPFSQSANVTRASSPAPTDFSFINPPSPEAESDPGPQVFFQRSRRHRRFHTVYDGPPSPRVMKNIFPRLWGALSSPARKSRIKPPTGAFFLDPHLSYADLPPLDGEEGELIDDEACFVGGDNASAASGFDIATMLPVELCILIFRHLDIASILVCQRVSREWRRLADDNAVWRQLFFRREGWAIDLALGQARGWMLSPSAFLRDDYFSPQNTFSHLSLPALHHSADSPSPYATPIFMTPAPPSPIVLLPSLFSPERPTALPPAMPPLAHAPLTLPWRSLYRAHLTLDARWSTPAFPPRTMRLTGHTSSVYCVEFDSMRIVTGARDHSVRVWRITDGACLGTLYGHTGSVLCLKFQKDWDVQQQQPGGGPGLLVTGSSDRTVRVWDLHALPGGAVEGTVRGVLDGHRGGVLDLRIDDRWIVSSSKDTRICIWDRETLALHRTLVGHEGPVNSIALQADRLVSASGDGRIIVWDVASGECLRVLFDHPRGLACVEYKGDLIVSGSNDAKINIWSASTGECVRTLSAHTELVRALALDPDSGRLVSASYDRSVRVWDVRSGKLVREFLQHQGSHILDVKFDVCKIVSVSIDKTILITDFSEGLDAELFV